jgi:hypothetical protein
MKPMRNGVITRVKAFESKYKRERSASGYAERKSNAFALGTLQSRLWTWGNIRSYLKIIFWTNLSVGASF